MPLNLVKIKARFRFVGDGRLETKRTIGGRLKFSTGMHTASKVKTLTLSVLVAMLTLAGSSLAKADIPDNAPAADTNDKTSRLPTTPADREDIDKEITNAHLRASTGAKSLYSVQSAFTYNGSSINEPFAASRPQLSPGTVENDPAKLTGAISVKYRATDHDNLNLGVGVGWLTPTYPGQRGQIEDPYVAYGRVFKSGNVQNVFNLGLTKYTADSSVNRGLNWESDIDHTFLIGIGKTKLQLGVDIAWTREFYTSGNNGQQDTLAAYPFLEYEFTDRLSFRTVYRGITYFNTTDAQGTFTRDDATQSMGVGISVARDIYLYPNVQWVWSDIRSDKTNVALSANINL
jgi:hypothetical protein